MKVFANFLQKNGGDPTEEWATMRRGKITASEFHRFVKLDGTLRTGEMPESYLDEKLFERWTGRDLPNDFFKVDINNGLVIEEKAALFAEMKYGLQIQPVGFVSDDAERYGCSPDGLIGWTGLKADVPTEYLNGIKAGCCGIEIKGPSFKNQIRRVRTQEMPDDHWEQIQGSMLITGCQEWHFLSYSLACYLDGFPPLHLVIERDEKFCENLYFSLAKFLAKYDTEFDKLCEANGGPPKLTTPPTPKPDNGGFADPNDINV